MNAFLCIYSTIKGGCFSFSHGTLLHSACECESVHVYVKICKLLTEAEPQDALYVKRGK